jgi:hypothetical protein
MERVSSLRTFWVDWGIPSLPGLRPATRDRRPSAVDNRPRALPAELIPEGSPDLPPPDLPVAHISSSLRRAAESPDEPGRAQGRGAGVHATVSQVGLIRNSLATALIPCSGWRTKGLRRRLSLAPHHKLLSSFPGLWSVVYEDGTAAAATAARTASGGPPGQATGVAEREPMLCHAAAA